MIRHEPIQSDEMDRSKETDRSKEMDRSKCKRLLLVGCVLIIIVIILIIVLWDVFHKISYESNDERDIPITARVFSHSHHHYHCNDAGFDCCYIYTPDKKYKIDPSRIVAKDNNSTNCPTYMEIVNRYKDYINTYNLDENCNQSECCKMDVTYDLSKRFNINMHTNVIQLDRKNCPDTHYLIYLYTNRYPDPNMGGGFVIILILLGCCLLWLAFG